MDPDLRSKPRDQEFMAEVWLPADPVDPFSVYAPADPPQQEKFTRLSVLHHTTLTGGFLPSTVKSDLIEMFMSELEDLGMWDE